MPSQMIKIDKFTGKNNFSLWRIKMRALLKQQGIWTPLAGDRPEGMTDADFAQQDEKAHSTILLSLADEVIYEVLDEETAAALWLKLESLYMTKSLTNKLLLKQRLFSLRMKEGMPLKEHLDELNSILMDLKNVEVKIEDEDAALILLVSLPASYENFVNSFVVGRDTITMEEVRSSLHSRELRHKASGSGSESQSVGFKDGKNTYLGLNVSSRFYSILVVVKGQQLLFEKIPNDYTIVDLSGNKFEGEIPNEICSLNSLIVLNLSNNNLNGQIPHAIGNLSEIESLDLSGNQLTGKIPQSLADITYLEVLNLSQNHLVGRIPSGRQFNTFNSTSFVGNPELCGFPLPNHCEHSSTLPQLDADEDEESGFKWEVVMLGFGCGTLLGLAMGYLMLSTGKPKWFNAIADEIEHMIQRKRNKRRYIIYIGK